MRKRQKKKKKNGIKEIFRKEFFPSIHEEEKKKWNDRSDDRAALVSEPSSLL